MQQDVGNRACRQRGVDEDVGPGTGRQHHGAVARRKRLGRLPVERHDLDLMIFDFYCNNMALKSVDKAQPQPFMEAGESSSEFRPLTEQTGVVFPGTVPGVIAVPSGRSRQSSNSNTSSRSTATGSLSPTTSARAADGELLPSPKSLTSHMKVPA